MLINKTKIRVRYGETDQMGVVYHGSFAEYFEVGRVEWLRELGVSYKSMEEQGIMLPVVKLTINYKKPATYDEELLIVTKLKEQPTAKIVFTYEVHNENELLISTAETTLVFVDMKTGNPVACPDFISEKI